VQAVLAWFDLSYLEEKFDKWLVYFLGLVEPLTAGELKEMMSRFKSSPRLTAVVTQGKEAADQALLRLFRLQGQDRLDLYRLLSPMATEFLLYMMAKSRQENSRRAISLYFTHLKHLKPELKGRDLLAMGHPAGPMIKEMLNHIHEARLIEEVKTRAEEEDLIIRAFGRP
jgi:tRNA nucleotidyltransferase (CCA-adding enzyme)